MAIVVGAVILFFSSVLFSPLVLILPAGIFQ
jgi:hypothetical protein